MTDEQHHSSHVDPNIAYHFDWGFSRDAVLWAGDHPIGVNFHPFATEFRQWLQQKGHFSLLAEEHKGSLLSFTNPYSYNSSVIAGILARAVNAAHDFATGTEPLDDLEADIDRIRIYNEQILYTARFCEVTIKQLLYCTQISKRYYKNASLGALLSIECRSCKDSGKPRHKISMLGSLAHRYRLCLPFEHCLFEHIKIVNRRRNVEAAHSETQMLRIRSSSASRAQLMQDSVDAGKELVHMLQHISDLESCMMEELRAGISRGVESAPNNSFKPKPLRGSA